MVKDIWTIQDDDRIPIESLYDIEVFFLDDLRRAEEYAEKVLRYKKYNLPGYEDMVQKAIDEIDESEENLSIVRNKIKQQLHLIN